MCMCVCVCTLCVCRNPQRPDEGAKSFGVRVTGSFKLPDVGAGNLI